jgi:hypothetical protein
MNFVEVMGYCVALYVGFLFLEETKNGIKNTLLERKARKDSQELLRFQKEENKEQPVDQYIDMSDLLLAQPQQFTNVHTGKRIYRLDLLVEEMKVMVRECLVGPSGLITYSEPVIEQGDVYSVSERLIRK